MIFQSIWTLNVFASLWKHENKTYFIQIIRSYIKITWRFIDICFAVNNSITVSYKVSENIFITSTLCSRNWKVADMNWKWLKANWKISNLSNRPWVIFNSYQGIIIISDDYNSARRFVTAYGRIAHRGSLMWVRFELDLGGVMIINGDLKWFLTVPMIQTDQDEFIASCI